MPEKLPGQESNISDGMDVAAEQAREEFNKEWTARDVAIWWTKWYKHAGHKRLGRLLVEFAK